MKDPGFHHQRERVWSKGFVGEKWKLVEALWSGSGASEGGAFVDHGVPRKLAVKHRLLVTARFPLDTKAMEMSIIWEPYKLI